MKIELLNTDKHNRNGFDCGVCALNQYLKQFANQDQKRGLARVYVLVQGSQIIGYYSISAHAVSINNLPNNKGFGVYHDVPFLLLGRLAVDTRHQRNGYGDALIFHAFKTTAQVAEQIGIRGIIVDAKDGNAASFYQKFGFKQLIGTKNRLMLPFSAIEPLLD